MLTLFGLSLGACATPQSNQTPEPESSIQDAGTPTQAAPLALPAIEMADGLNRVVTLEEPALRVVSLAPSNTEILFAVGAGQQVVGRDDFSDYPAQAIELPLVGGDAGKFDLEAIVALQPDLVLASELNTPDQVKAIEDLGLNVFLLANPKDMEGMYQNLLKVATLTGHTQEAFDLVLALKGRVAAVEEKLMPISSAPLVFYEIDATDPNAPYTSGPGTFIDALIRMAGGSNLGGGLGSPYGQISLEELVQKNPSIILLGDSVWGGVTPEAVAQRPGWEKLAAVQSQQVYPFDDNLVSRPGPRLVDGLEALAKLLHPGVFQ
jgi:iron complex transport system substrate-binding protein